MTVMLLNVHPSARCGGERSQSHGPLEVVVRGPVGSSADYTAELVEIPLLPEQVGFAAIGQPPRYSNKRTLPTTLDSESLCHCPCQCITLDTSIYKFSRHHLDYKPLNPRSLKDKGTRIIY